MPDIDLSKLFDSMSTEVGGAGNPIKTIYDIIPTYDPVQQKMLFMLQYFINKWGLRGIDGMLVKFTDIMKDNKNLSFFGNKALRDMLSAYTQADMMGRINIRATNNNDSEV